MFLHFQRWKRRYFKLKGRKLYYAKDTKVIKTDEFEKAWKLFGYHVWLVHVYSVLSTLKFTEHIKRNALQIDTQSKSRQK